MVERRPTECSASVASSASTRPRRRTALAARGGSGAGATCPPRARARGRRSSPWRGSITRTRAPVGEHDQPRHAELEAVLEPPTTIIATPVIEKSCTRLPWYSLTASAGPPHAVHRRRSLAAQRKRVRCRSDLGVPICRTNPDPRGREKRSTTTHLVVAVRHEELRSRPCHVACAVRRASRRPNARAGVHERTNLKPVQSSSKECRVANVDEPVQQPRFAATAVAEVAARSPSARTARGPTRRRRTALDTSVAHVDDVGSAAPFARHAHGTPELARAGAHPAERRTTLSRRLRSSARCGACERQSERTGGLRYRVGEIGSVERARADDWRLVPETDSILRVAKRRVAQIASGRKAKVVELEV